jgi:hypothetical protein
VVTVGILTQFVAERIDNSGIKTQELASHFATMNSNLLLVKKNITRNVSVIPSTSKE